MDALDGFFIAEKRSQTLDGSIPVRASQGCKPFLEGNGAGVQLRLAPTMILEASRPPRLRTSRDVKERISALHAAALPRLIAAGVLEQDGYWHRLLKQGFMWTADGEIHIWTGLLARAAPGSCILLGPAFNRRCRIHVGESVIADDTKFVPLVLRLDPLSINTATALNRGELACLTPLLAKTSLRTERIRANPALVTEFDEFYDPEYTTRREGRKQTGKYRRLVQGERSDSWVNQESRIIDLGGPECFTIRSFSEFVTSTGPAEGHPYQETLSYADVRTICRINGRYDGSYVSGPFVKIDRPARKLAALWDDVGANLSGTALKLLTNYANRVADQLQEPHITVVPWLFVATPSGWSTLIDGYSARHLEGLRGIISTDLYPFNPAPVMRVDGPGGFALPKGAPLARILPVPRALLHAPVKRVSSPTADT
ncbi:hypothetical protein [Streptomyces sp. NPDC060027]|uniref:hypothetical protein n=1 Tax=Streptomyces sp. NPDC060027 TaxID=3347040 RepID=UPI0036CBC99F